MEPEGDHKFDLDELERKARAVRAESGDAEWFNAMGEYRAVALPPMTLALIARFRALEAELIATIEQRDVYRDRCQQLAELRTADLDEAKLIYEAVAAELSRPPGSTP